MVAPRAAAVCQEAVGKGACRSVKYAQRGAVDLLVFAGDPPHLRRDWARPCHICPGTGLSPYHICPGTGLTPAHICPGTWPIPAFSAPRLGSPLHICTGTALTPATSAPGPGSPLPHLHQDWAHPAHICARTALTPPTSPPGPDALGHLAVRPRASVFSCVTLPAAEPGPGADVAGVSPVPAQMWEG
jgi:hypothetical protein